MTALTRTLGSDNPAVKLWARFIAARKGCTLRCGPYAWDLIKGARGIRIGRGQFANVADLAEDFDDLFAALTPAKLGTQELLDFSRVHLHTFRESDLAFELEQWPERDAAMDAYFEVYRPVAENLVFDLGAECGVSTYVISQIAGKVVAFEPAATTRVILERNVQRHKLANVMVAKDTVGSFAELCRIYGVPAFCRVNLDQVKPEFFLPDAREWTSQTIFMAARSRSRGVRKKFAALLKDVGFETDSDVPLGMIWARPGVMWHAHE